MQSKHLLNTQTLITLSHSFVYPYLNYAAEVWEDASNLHLRSVLKLQKKAVRIISQVGWRDHTFPLFSKLNILRLEEIHFYKLHYQCLKFIIAWRLLYLVVCSLGILKFIDTTLGKLNIFMYPRLELITCYAQ